MYYLDNKSGVVIMPPPQDTQSDTPLWFSEDKDAPSYPGADWFNIVTLELINILKLGGVSPDKFKFNQLASVIGQLLSASSLMVNSELEGLDKTTNGMFFCVPQGVGQAYSLIYFRNDNGIAVPVAASLGKASLDEIEQKIPYRKRSPFWLEFVALNGLLGGGFRESDNRLILSEGGDIVGRIDTLEILKGTLDVYDSISAAMIKLPVNSGFIVQANDIDHLKTPGLFRKTAPNDYQKLFSLVSDEQVSVRSRSPFWLEFVARNGLLGGGFRESDNRLILSEGGDIAGRLDDYLQRIHSLEQHTTNSTASDIAGDSTAVGAGAEPGGSFPEQLAALIGNDFVINNMGIGGQKSGQVAMRMGAKAIYLTVSGDAIPANGNLVTITHINGDSATAAPSVPSADVRFLTTASNNSTYTLDGWIAGIKCRVTRTVNSGIENYTLTALEGAGFRCLPGSLFVPDYALQNHSDRELWIAVGINDFRSGAVTASDYDDDVAAIKMNVDALIEFGERSGRNILLYGINTCNYPVEFLQGIRYQRVIEVNQYWAARYPNHYVRGDNGRDVREELISRFNPSSPQDVTDFDNDIVPESLRSDNRHPNTNGYAVYAELGQQFRVKRGY
jgi:lysophospholipase L1-like esterase